MDRASNYPQAGRASHPDPQSVFSELSGRFLRGPVAMGVAPSTSSEAPAEAVWPSDWHKIPGKSRKIARAAILDISVRCGHHPLTRMRLARAHHSHLPGVTIVVRLALGARASNIRRACRTGSQAL